MNPPRVDAPWTEAQVENLNRYQAFGLLHEFTCLNDHEGRAVLIATRDGWHCPTCGYHQTWAHRFMVEFTQEAADHYRAQLSAAIGTSL